MSDDFRIDVMRPVAKWAELFYPFWRRCTQRILIVTDGALSFDPTSGFGLSRFVAEVAKITPTPTITKAHRSADPTADLQNFIFNASVSRTTYDQIWLFGFNPGPVITDAEFQVLANFMNAGGGLFATGDHENLGYAMGGELPRVRKMRDWSTIPAGTNTRIDTVTNPGPDHLTQFHDQSDEFPQRIFPHYYGSGVSFAPHPLLRSPVADIDVMPDHPHESVCLVGPNLNANYNLHGLNFVEFPLFNGNPLAPEIIATSASAGRFLTDIHKPPTTPRCFGSISVWDGHKVGRGRIVCDSTWHHFVNINLDGTGAAPQVGNNRNGLRDTMLNFTPDFHQIAEYYRNIADWIIPSNRRWCRWWIDFVIERYRFPLVEEWTPMPHPCPWELRVRLGAMVEDAFKVNRGRGIAEEIVTLGLEDAGLEDFAELIRPARAEDIARSKQYQQLVSTDDVRRAVLGTLFDAFVRDLPTNPFDLPKELKGREHDDDLLLKTAIEAAGLAIDGARDHYNESVRQTISFIERATAKRPQQKESPVKATTKTVATAKPAKNTASKKPKKRSR